MFRAIVVCAVLTAACKSDGGSTDETLETPVPTTPKKSAGGFSEALSQDLAGETAGSGERIAGTATGESSSPASAGSGSGSAKATPVVAAGSGSGSAKATPPTPSTPTPPTPVVAVGPGSAKATPPAPTPPTPVVAATKPTPPAPIPPSTPAKPVEMTPALKAIKLSLLPNWKRDDGEAASISLFVDMQTRSETAVFRFYYGYDDIRAPSDRDAYKKFLTETKILTVTSDRQRGAAWYLEGTDAQGRAAFRILVTYDSKRLICGGPLYKDSPFGDVRDEVILQAKKICETIQL